MNDDLHPSWRVEDDPAIRKLERRLRRAEGQLEVLKDWHREAKPQLAEIRDRELIAEAIAEKVDRQRHGRFSRREQAIGAAVALATIVQTAQGLGWHL